jgi:hypothetical protein
VQFPPATRLLPTVHVPTLVLQRDAGLLAIGNGRYVADHIEGAKFRALPGSDPLFFFGETAEMLDAIEEFLMGRLPPRDIDRALATVLFTDVVGSTDNAVRLGDRGWRNVLDAHDAVVRAQLDRSGDERSTRPVTGSSPPSTVRRARSSAVAPSATGRASWAWMCALVSTPEKSSYAGKRSGGSRCTSASASRASPDLVRSSCRGPSPTFSPGRGSRSPIEASMSSRVCLGRGGCSRPSSERPNVMFTVVPALAP